MQRELVFGGVGMQVTVTAEVGTVIEHTRVIAYSLQIDNIEFAKHEAWEAVQRWQLEDGEFTILVQKRAGRFVPDVSYPGRGTDGEHTAQTDLGLDASALAMLGE